MAGQLEHETQLRVRYSETDQMGTFYNSRALEWFECGRTELLRSLGRSYADMEQAGTLLPLTEAYVRYHGRAKFDDLLRVFCQLSMPGRARLRFDMRVDHAKTADPVCSGYTVHAVTDTAGKPTRPPRWLVELIEPA